MKKNKLLQKGFIMLILAAFVLPSSFTAYASELAIPLQQETRAEVSPLWVYSHTQTITIEYNAPLEIPEEYHYEYDHNTYGRMRGVLKNQGYEIVKGKYIVTFTGQMYSNPL